MLMLYLLLYALLLTLGVLFWGSVSDVLVAKSKEWDVELTLGQFKRYECGEYLKGDVKVEEERQAVASS